MASPHNAPLETLTTNALDGVNRLFGRYQSRDDGAVLAFGGALLRVPFERVRADVGERLTISLRPECIRLDALGPDTLLSATVIAHVVHGDHVEIQVDVPALGSNLFVRQPGIDALTRWPIGAAAGLSFDVQGLSAVAAEPPSPL
ncbi:TOBE domain-containing protein [Pseudomonas sp. NPDC088368]|jgi:putative spermidine/putrescine transport system ATP-binding protein|uniref:TOBE domain-containing protein n=1 Tax=Pseudomonas sp. NPDC088368 TaxID=3364453 RepID=UPI0037FDF85C